MDGLSPDLVCAAGNTISVWNAKEGSALHYFESDTPFQSVDFCKDGQTLVSSAMSEKVIISVIGKNGFTHREIKTKFQTSVARFHGTRILGIGSSLGTIHVMDIKREKTSTHPSVQQHKITDMHFSSRESSNLLVAAGNSHGGVMLYNVTPHHKSQNLVSCDSNHTINSVRFSKENDKYFATASDSGVVKIWHAEAHKAVFSAKHTSPATCIEYSPIDITLYSVGLDKSFNIYDTRMLGLTKSHMLSEPLSAIAINDAGHIVTIGTTKGKLWMYDLRMFKKMLNFCKQDKVPITSIALRNGFDKDFNLEPTLLSPSNDELSHNNSSDLSDFFSPLKKDLTDRVGFDNYSKSENSSVTSTRILSQSSDNILTSLLKSKIIEGNKNQELDAMKKPEMTEFEIENQKENKIERLLENNEDRLSSNSNISMAKNSIISKKCVRTDKTDIEFSEDSCFSLNKSEDSIPPKMIKITDTKFGVKDKDSDDFIYTSPKSEEAYIPMNTLETEISHTAFKNVSIDLDRHQPEKNDSLSTVRTFHKVNSRWTQTVGTQTSCHCGFKTNKGKDAAVNTQHSPHELTGSTSCHQGTLNNRREVSLANPVSNYELQNHQMIDDLKDSIEDSFEYTNRKIDSYCNNLLHSMVSHQDEQSTKFDALLYVVLKMAEDLENLKAK